MCLSFGAWYFFERSLDIHSIFTLKREGFYWLAVLFTFALGTAVGDFISETSNVGYGYTLLIFVITIFVIFLAWYFLKINDVLMFWLAYIMTRPLGASTEDLLASSQDEGGAGLGTTYTSILFLGIIAILVGILTVTKKD